MSSGNQFQFELWQECNNVCKFCYLGQENRFTPDEVKIKSLHELIDIIDEIDRTESYTNISVIGGEFFQGQLRNPGVKELFQIMYRKLFAFMDKDWENRGSWFSATLTIGDNKDLYEMLDEYYQTETYKHSIDGLWICTSWDSIGRFHTDLARTTWENHMKNLTLKYPKMHKNTCIILTNDLMEKYIAGDINFSSFAKEFGTQIFMKVPDFGSFGSKEIMESKVPGFFPTRKNAMKFLGKVAMTEPEYLRRMTNVNFRADILIKSGNNGSHKDCIRFKDQLNEYGKEATSLPCGHSTYYNCYIDSDACFKCDLANILEDM